MACEDGVCELCHPVLKDDEVTLHQELAGHPGEWLTSGTIYRLYGKPRGLTHGQVKKDLEHLIQAGCIEREKEMATEESGPQHRLRGWRWLYRFIAVDGFYEVASHHGDTLVIGDEQSGCVVIAIEGETRGPDGTVFSREAVEGLHGQVAEVETDDGPVKATVRVDLRWDGALEAVAYWGPTVAFEPA